MTDGNFLGGNSVLDAYEYREEYLVGFCVGHVGRTLVTGARFGVTDRDWTWYAYKKRSGGEVVQPNTSTPKYGAVKKTLVQLELLYFFCPNLV